MIGVGHDALLIATITAGEVYETSHIEALLREVPKPAGLGSEMARPPSTRVKVCPGVKRG